MTKHLFLILFVITNSMSLSEAAASPLGKMTQEAIKVGARKFGGKVLGRGSKKALVLAHPRATRVLAKHADDLLPVARRVGPEVLELEARHPGLALRTVETFGDDAAKALAKAPGGDLPMLLGYASKADSPATRQMLVGTYLKSQNRSAFLANLKWGHIMATGLATSAVVAAYQISDGIQEEKISVGVGKREGLKVIARENPEQFTKVIEDRSVLESAVDTITASLAIVIKGAALVLMLLAGFLLFRVGRWGWRFFLGPVRKANPTNIETGPSQT